MIGERAPVPPGAPRVWWGMKGTTAAAGRRVVTMGDGRIANEAAAIIDIAQSVDNIHTACLDAGRDPASVGIRAPLALRPAALQASGPHGAQGDARPAAPDTDAVP